MEAQTEKQNMLTELYALRAGLSAVSVKADEVRELERAANASTANMEKVKDEYNSQKIRVDNAAQDVKNKYDRYQDFVNFKNANIKGRASGAGRSKSKLITAIIHYWLITLAIGVGFGIGALVIGGGLGMGIGALVGFAVYVLAVVCITVTKKRSRIKSATYEIENEIRQEKQAYEGAQRQLELEKSKLADWKTRIENASSAYGKEQREIEENSKRVASEAKVYNSALEIKYSSLLSTVDWENLDLVIHYLSTGRADTVKEALQQVDMQRRNEAIVSEIQNANASVCNEIHGGLRSLGSAMGVCFKALSDQISAVSRQVSVQSKLIAGFGGAVVDGVELNNKLREKANTTSQQLVKDIKYIQSKIIN